MIMGRRENMKEKLDNITLPQRRPDDDAEPHELDSLYIPLLRELGVRTKGDLRLLEVLIDEKVAQLGRDIMQQSAAAGISPDAIPRVKVRSRSGRESIMHPDFLPWAALINYITSRRSELEEILREENELFTGGSEPMISRETYKKIKNMSYEKMNAFFAAVYSDGAKTAPACPVDKDALRKDIGSVKGVGESRLNEIMTIIDKHLN